ncbi:MAG: hypothetical protein LBP90_00105 [Burkholderiales bacterium]|jgi:hypothetical protein|nr:hypothetical protein [Burkholderiales bacterium]
MEKVFLGMIIVGAAFILSGCETTNSTPYKASTENVISIQKNTPAGAKVELGEIASNAEAAAWPVCRLSGAVNVAPGKTPAQYIKEALQEELFMAQIYQHGAPTTISGRLEDLNFSSVSPASWSITLSVKSNVSQGYTVSVKYPFDTSWSAYSACRNVAAAFGPAVQDLLKQVVNNPKFPELVGSTNK